MEWHAVHTSPFNGIPDSNELVKVLAITNYQISYGRITEHVAMFAALTLMQQIGAMQAEA